MHGAWQRFVIALVIAAPAVALPYHNGSMYDRAPGAGGGGGLFFTGAQRERGWNCTACHVDAKELDVVVTSQPAELIADGRYQPSATYAITIALANAQQQLGLAATRTNFNAMVASTSAGVITGFDPGRYYARGTSILASDSTALNETSWTFSWTAPASGSVTFDIGVVDGNGGDSIGDAVAMIEITVGDAAALRAVTWAFGGLAALRNQFSVAALRSSSAILRSALATMS